MALSSNNIKAIKHIADKLEKWSELFHHSTCSARNLWMELTLSLYPHEVHNIASWLGGIPVEGRKVRRKFEELCQLVQEVDAWRNQGIYLEDLGEFRERNNRLVQAASNFISILRNISGSSESDPPEDKADTEEISEVLQTTQSTPASPAADCPSDVAPSQEALMAYKLHCETGLTIQQVAKRMTAELKLDKALRPWQILRWIKQVENRDIHARIPIRSVAPRTSGATARSAGKMPPHKPTRRKI